MSKSSEEQVAEMVTQAQRQDHQPDLHGRDLSGLGLFKANLRGADLGAADLSPTSPCHFLSSCPHSPPKVGKGQVQQGTTTSAPSATGMHRWIRGVFLGHSPACTMALALTRISFACIM